MTTKHVILHLFSLPSNSTVSSTTANHSTISSQPDTSSSSPTQPASSPIKPASPTRAPPRYNLRRRPHRASHPCPPRQSRLFRQSSRTEGCHWSSSSTTDTCKPETPAPAPSPTQASHVRIPTDHRFPPTHTQSVITRRDQQPAVSSHVRTHATSTVTQLANTHS